MMLSRPRAAATRVRLTYDIPFSFLCPVVIRRFDAPEVRGVITLVRIYAAGCGASERAADLYIRSFPVQSAYPLTAYPRKTRKYIQAMGAIAIVPSGAGASGDTINAPRKSAGTLIICNHPERRGKTPARRIAIPKSGK